MHSQSSILGTALLVSAALAAPVPQITTTVSEPIAGWGGASYSNTAINPQAGDLLSPFGYGVNPYNPYAPSLTPEGRYDGECSVFRRYRGECTLDQPYNSWGNNNDWYDRAVQTDASVDSSETTISKRDNAQYGPSYYGGYGGYGGYYGGAYRPYGYRYSPYGVGYGYGYRPYGYPYYGYYRQGEETAQGQKTENAELTPAADATAPAAAPAAPAADAAAATTTVQNTKRQTVGSVSFGGIQPSFTVDNGEPVYPNYQGGYPGYQGYQGYAPTPAYYGWQQWWNSLRPNVPAPLYVPGYSYVPGYQPGYAGAGLGVAQAPGIAGTFSVDSTKKA